MLCNAMGGGVIPYQHRLVIRMCTVNVIRMPDSREPGFESSLCYRFEVWPFSFSPRHPSSLSCINVYLALDSAGNVIE